MKKILSVVLAGAIAVSATALATADESVQTVSIAISPSKLSKSKFSNVAFTNTLETANDPEWGEPPTQTRTLLDFSKNFKFNYADWPTCKVDLNTLAMATTADAAKQACGAASIVSDDARSSAEVTVGGAPPGFETIFADLVAFNGPKKTLIFYGKSTGNQALIPPVVFSGKLKDSKAGRKFGQALDVSIPALSVGSTSLFELTIARSRYVQIKCSPATVSVRATTTYEDGSKSVDDDSIPCKPKR